MEQFAQTIYYVDQLIQVALGRKASDIHIEPRKDNVCIKFRIDGIIHDHEQLHLDRHAAIIARIKVLAGLNTAERRLPQDGKFELVYHDHAISSRTINNRSIDIRVATFPCVWGERVVLRLLDVQNQIFDINALGLLPALHDKLIRALDVQQGCILVTGPTGSGKTTTLHALLRVLYQQNKHIITLEDPIEYTVPQISQAHIRSDIGFTFEQALRAVLRQDPDVIMIGEIRDATTAHAAFRAGLTGHMVMSSVHAYDALSVIARLIDMDIAPFFVAHALTTIIAQRLVRVLCENCKIEQPISDHDKQLMIRLDIPASQLDILFVSHGCEQCNQLGYCGRMALFEILELSNALRKQILQEASKQELSDQARQDGAYYLKDHALFALQKGHTSLAEIARVLL